MNNGMPIGVGQLAHLADVLHGHRGGAREVVEHRDDDERDAPMMAFQRHAQLGEVEVPLERLPLVEPPERVAHQVDSHRAPLFDVGLGRVEVRVVEDDVSRFEMKLHQDVFGGAPLVRGHDVLETP